MRCRLGIASCRPASVSRRSKSLPPYRYPSTAKRTLGSIWAKRSTTLAGPKSGEQLDQTAPMLAVARKATIASGTLGM